MILQPNTDAERSAWAKLGGLARKFGEEMESGRLLNEKLSRELSERNFEAGTAQMDAAMRERFSALQARMNILLDVQDEMLKELRSMARVFRSSNMCAAAHRTLTEFLKLSQVFTSTLVETTVEVYTDPVKLHEFTQKKQEETLRSMGLDPESLMKKLQGADQVEEEEEKGTVITVPSEEKPIVQTVGEETVLNQPPVDTDEVEEDSPGEAV